MRRLLVAAVALALPALAACGGGGDDARAVSIKTLQAAASNTQEAESARFTAQITGVLTLSATGTVSGDGRRGQITIEAPNGTKAEERIVDGVIYFDSSGFGIAPEGKRWFSLDLDKLEGGSALSPFGSATPASALETLQRLAGPVQTVGDDMVAGRHATHYRASIDRTGFGSSPVDVWIDDDDRVVKMHVSIGGIGTEMTMEITEFGVPVDVVPPPPEEVGSLPYDLPGWGLFDDDVTA